MDRKVKIFQEKSLTLATALVIAVAREAAVKNATTPSNTLDRKILKTEPYAMQNDLMQMNQHQRGGGREVKVLNTDSRYGLKQQQQRPAGSPLKSFVRCYCCGKHGYINRECEH